MITSFARLRHTLSCLLLLAAGATSALAQEDIDGDEPLITDRPDFTESAVSVQPGRVQLEAGYTYEEAGPVATQSFGGILVRIGLSEAIELRLAANSFVRERDRRDEASGIENSFVGIKIETGAGSDEPSFAKPASALLIGTSLPTGGREVREPHAEPGVVLALDWTTGGAVGVASNVGLSYASEDGEQFLLGLFSVAAGTDFGGGWGGFLEYFSFIPDGSGREVEHFVDSGVTYLISNDFQLDLSVGTELSGETDYFAGIGLAYRW